MKNNQNTTIQIPKAVQDNLNELTTEKALEYFKRKYGATVVVQAKNIKKEVVLLPEYSCLMVKDSAYLSGDPKHVPTIQAEHFQTLFAQEKRTKPISVILRLGWFVKHQLYTVMTQMSFQQLAKDAPELQGMTKNEGDAAYTSGSSEYYTLSDIHVSDVQVCKEIKPNMNVVPRNSIVDAEKEFLKDFPELKEYINGLKYNRIPTELFYMAPYLAVLYRERYISLLWQVSEAYRRGQTLTKFQKLCHDGRSLDEIFSVPREVYTNFRVSLISISTWDILRKLSKECLLSSDTVQFIVTKNLGDAGIRDFYRILHTKCGQKEVFTANTLAAYLDKLNMYESLDPTEALHYLSEYVSYCGELGAEPYLVPGSLLREHHVAEKLRQHTSMEEEFPILESVCAERHKSH